MTAPPPTAQTAAVFDAPTAAVYRATAQATRQWWAAREVLIHGHDLAVQALLRRYGVVDEVVSIELVDDEILIDSTTCPRHCHDIIWNDAEFWTPDRTTEQGRQLTDQIAALPPQWGPAQAEAILGLPGGMPLTRTRNGKAVRRQALTLEGRMYLGWEQDLDAATALDPTVWERVDAHWWASTRQQMHIDDLIASLQTGAGRHRYHRTVDARIDQVLTLVWDVSVRTRNPQVLTQARRALEQSHEPIRELIVREQDHRARIAPGMDADPRQVLDQIIADLHTLTGPAVAA